MNIKGTSKEAAMLTEQELREMAERLDNGLGRFAPGSAPYYALSRIVSELRSAQGEVRRHDDARGLQAEA